MYLGSIPGSASMFLRHSSAPLSGIVPFFARMAKLVYAADLKSAGHCDRAGSSPAPGTIYQQLHFYLSWTITLQIEPGALFNLIIERLDQRTVIEIAQALVDQGLVELHVEFGCR